MSEKDLLDAPIPAFQPEPLTDANDFVSWLLGERGCPPPATANVYRYAVCQCFDTFVWGKRIGSEWVWADRATVGDDIRAPRKETLLEARAFGPSEETLVWRNEAAGSSSFHGRVVKETSDAVYLKRCAAFHPQKSTKPSRDGDPDPDDVTETKHSHFVRRRLGNGRTTITPKGMGVLVYEYLQEQSETGAVRIFLTRFVDILATSENSQEQDKIVLNSATQQAANVASMTEGEA